MDDVSKKIVARRRRGERSPRCVFLFVFYFSSWKGENERAGQDEERKSRQTEKVKESKREKEKKEINERKRDTMGEGPG